MIVEVTMYTVVCDNCKEHLESDYCLQPDKLSADDEAFENEWSIDLADEDKHYCPECRYYNENNEWVINKERTKKEANNG